MALDLNFIFLGVEMVESKLFNHIIGIFFIIL